MTAQMSEDLAADLRATVRTACDRMGGTERARRRIVEGTPGHDAEAWQLLAQQVGVAALGLPEAAGGIGGLRELLAVAEELGRSLLPVPFLTSTAMAAQVLGCCAPDHVLQRLLAGESAALVSADVYGGTTRDVELQGDRISGSWSFVPGAPGASLLVVPLQGRVWLVDAVDDGVRVTASPSLDLASTVGSVRLAAAQAVDVGPAELVEEVLPVARAALAADQLGGAAACLEMTVDYVKTRAQFGRPVGSFQAVKHTAADMLVQVELARSAVLRCSEAEPGRKLAEAALVARIWCSDAYRFVTAESIQLHGGIGFTWEHDAHLYFRRARVDALTLGTTSAARQRLADLLRW